MDSTMWPELPPDVLREISRRLDDAADFVHFHSVCKPWRDSHESTMATRRKQWVLPWLLQPDQKKIPLKIPLKLRCVFSARRTTTYRALLPFSVRPRAWVASTDGTAVWYFRAGPKPSLHDPLTGVVTLLPPFPKEKDCRRWEGSTSGIVYSDDGTVFLRSLSRHRNTTKFRAAVLLPGATAWKVVDRTLVVVGSHELDDIYSYYFRGKIRITAPRGLFPAPDLHYKFVQSYMLESHGELLCVSVYISLLHYREAASGGGVAGLLRALSVTVHVMLEEEESPPGVMLWARKDCKSLADQVLFLGWPTSFAMDASRLHSDAASGGCAYFVYHDVEDVMSNQPCHVLIRYNLIDNKAKFVERLPEAWNNDMFMWLFPQPSIAPTKEIIDRIEGRKWWKKKMPHTDPTPRSNIYMELPQPQCYNTYLKLSVHNLPPEVDSFQLEQFFGKHGKVSNAEVVCNKRKNKMSNKIGLLTIAMVEERAYALAALNGLVFNGCILDVRLVRRWKQGRPVHPTGSNQHSRGYLISIVLLLFMFILTVRWKLA